MRKETEKIMRPGDGPAICITMTGGQNNLHPDGRRYTLREFAVLQGFPLFHAFPPMLSESACIGQIGNAFPPSVVKILLRSVRQQLQQADNKPIPVDDFINEDEQCSAQLELQIALDRQANGRREMDGGVDECGRLQKRRSSYERRKVEQEEAKMKDEEESMKKDEPKKEEENRKEVVKVDEVQGEPASRIFRPYRDTNGFIDIDEFFSRQMSLEVEPSQVTIPRRQAVIIDLEGDDLQIIDARLRDGNAEMAGQISSSGLRHDPIILS
jgi:hypothetical protein